MTLRADDLRDGQRALLQQMEDFPDGIAVLDMGDGKTATTLYAIQNLISCGDIKRAIVIAPPATLSTAWAKEPYKWLELKGLKVAILDGGPKDRERCLEEARHDVYVVSSNVTKWLVELFKKWSRRKAENRPMELLETLLVIDEISQFSNPNSVRGNKLLWMTRRAAGTWGLTGTPRPKKYEQLFLPLKLVAGENVWGHTAFTDWRQDNFKPEDYQGYSWTPFPWTVDIIERTARTFMFVAPPRTSDKIEVMEHDHWVDMLEAQTFHYEEMYEELVAQGVVPATGEEWTVEAFSRGVGAGKLAQIAQGFLYRDGEAPVAMSDVKLTELKVLDEQLLGSPTLVLYGLLEEMAQIAEYYESIGTSYRILGDGITGKRRNSVIEEWRAGEVERLICHPAAMSHGVDGLQEQGHHLVWYHPTWSSEQYWQTVKRLARPGQKHEVVHSYRILARKTLDEHKVLRVAHDRAEELAFMERMRS